MADNADRTRRALDRLSGDAAGSGTKLQGYEDSAGVTRAIAGDTDSAFTKQVPFPEQPRSWQTGITLPLSGTDAYLSLPPIDVGKWNEIIVFFEYDAQANTSRLSVIPEGSLVKGVVDSSVTEQFFRIAAFDAAFVAAEIASSGFNEVFAQRAMLAQELRTTAGPTAVQFYAAPFQVTYFQKFRVSVADLVGTASTLNVYYARSNG